MFVEKSIIELITIDEEIKIVGINLQNSGLPIHFESLGKLWGIYREKHRGKEKNAVTPIVEYAVCLNKMPDYISGYAVTKIGDLEEGWFSFVAPKGKYIKSMWNAETFELLVEETFEKNKNIKEWAKKNNVKVNGEFMVEVYPKTTENGNVEMYILVPVKE